jgi:hypothetical protein
MSPECRRRLLYLPLVSLLLLACEGDSISPPASSAALLKFCNLRAGANNQATEITLEIGNPAVRISARSGTCAPAVGQGCQAIQSGTAVPVALREEGRQLAAELLDVQVGEEWILVAYPDDPILDGGELREAFPCSSFDLDKLR